MYFSAIANLRVKMHQTVAGQVEVPMFQQGQIAVLAMYH